MARVVKRKGAKPGPKPKKKSVAKRAVKRVTTRKAAPMRTRVIRNASSDSHASTKKGAIKAKGRVKRALLGRSLKGAGVKRTVTEKRGVGAAAVSAKEARTRIAKIPATFSSSTGRPAKAMKPTPKFTGMSKSARSNHMSRPAFGKSTTSTGTLGGKKMGAKKKSLKKGGRS